MPSEGGQRSRRTSSRVDALFEEKYRVHAEWEGDERSKRDAASARRMATGAIHALQKFDRLLPTDDVEVLQRAVSILDTLADDLDKVGVMSRTAKTKRERHDWLERTDKADKAAAARWASDDAMRAEAIDLAAFVDQRHQLATKAWLLSIHPECQLVDYPDHMPQGMRLIDLLNRQSSPTEVVNLRRRSAEYVLALEAGQRCTPRRYKDMWHVGLDDYEAWRAWRSRIHATITPP